MRNHAVPGLRSAFSAYEAVPLTFKRHISPWQMRIWASTAPAGARLGLAQLVADALVPHNGAQIILNEHGASTSHETAQALW